MMGSWDANILLSVITPVIIVGRWNGDRPTYRIASYTDTVTTVFFPIVRLSSSATTAPSPVSMVSCRETIEKKAFEILLSNNSIHFCVFFSRCVCFSKSVALQ